MNEVTKLYENAEIEKLSVCEYTCMNATNCNVNCVHYNDKTTYYPPFTAEKQLELIKFLLEKYCDIRIRKNLEGAYYITSFNDISCFSEDFEETLANFTNTHLQDLTEEERKQIKEIVLK